MESIQSYSRYGPRVRRQGLRPARGRGRAATIPTSLRAPTIFR